MTTKKTTPVRRRVLVGTSDYGLFVGETEQTDAEIFASPARTIRLLGARHVRYWYGKSGGITSLAAHGPCGPRVSENLIGAPTDSTIAEVRNIYDVPPEAWQAFASIVVK